ncbi:MAG: peptide chain release factor N(5)-glutamine methyltransferase [Gallionella sp.]
MSSSSIQALLQQHSKELEEALNLEAGSARIEVQYLLQAVLQVDRAYLLSHPERSLDADQHERYMALLERRLHGEPIAYLLASREFYGLNFKVTPATLIPRPETELLVDLALQHIPLHSGFRLLDLGTGSGAIALSIARARPNAEVMAVDASPSALEVARENAQRLNICNVRLTASDWFTSLQDECFDMIVSNPPYVAVNDPHLLQGDLCFEPRNALASGADGLDDIRLIISQAKAHLNPGGWLLLEHGHDQADRVRALLQQAGLAGIFSAHDLSGIDRVSGGSCLP